MLYFNDTVTRKGIVQGYERELNLGVGYISGSVERLKNLTADVNLTCDDYFTLGFKSSGTWQLDDSNFTDYPIISTTITPGQRDYPFLTDQTGNLILDIYKVELADASGIYRELKPVDQQSSNNGYFDESNFSSTVTGTPIAYDKTANAIIFDVIPNFTGTLKVWINREPYYFLYTDTTKIPGIPGNHHKYLYLKPAEDYARRNSLDIHDRVELEVVKMERDITETFGRREKDVRRRLIANIENNK